MNRKKILIQNDILVGGGAEKVLYDLSLFLSQQGHHITIKTHKRSVESFNQLFPKTITYFSTERPKFPQVPRFSASWCFHKLMFIFSLCRTKYLLHRRYDIAISMKEGPCAIEILKTKAKQHFSWVHVDYRFLHWTKSHFQSNEEELNCFKSYNKVICVSQATSDGLVSTIGDPNNVQICYNPIDYTSIIENSLLPCNQPKPKDKLLFVSVGRLASEKQYLMLAEVCLELSKTLNFELWIVGNGPERIKLQSFINQHNLSCVKLLGESDNPFPFMRQADCYISSSLAESYGFTIQEALILGIPTIVTACPAMYEVLDQRFGMIVPNNANGLKNAMEFVINNPNCLITYRQNIERFYDSSTLWLSRLNNISTVLGCDKT